MNRLGDEAEPLEGLLRRADAQLVPMIITDGLNVVLNYHANEANADETRAACADFGERAQFAKADISRADEATRLVKTALDKFDALDVLVNNASINIDRSLLDMTEAEWDRVVDTNMKSVFLQSQAAARVMVRRDAGGQIVNLGALTGITGRANGINYCAAKAGVIVMTKCLAIELAPKVRVNCVLPGTVRTPEIDERYDLAANEPRFAEQTLLKCIGEPEDVANAIRFLISDAAAYITGQKLIVDGGSFLY